jgi:hypothetical protein
METQSGLVGNVASKRDYRKRRLLTVGHLDGRTRGSKRARQIAAELTGGFGPEITKTQKQAAERAAMLCALAEDLAARRLAGEAVSLDELMRLEGVARRAVARLGLPEARKVPAGLSPGLALARQRWTAQDKQRKAHGQEAPK